jgi:hypothetical protein
MATAFFYRNIFRPIRAKNKKIYIKNTATCQLPLLVNSDKPTAAIV